MNNAEFNGLGPGRNGVQRYKKIVVEIAADSRHQKFCR